MMNRKPYLSPAITRIAFTPEPIMATSDGVDAITPPDISFDSQQSEWGYSNAPWDEEE